MRESPLPWTPTTVLRADRGAARPRAESDAERRLAGAGERDLEGKLAQLPLADLLQLFHLNRRTGTIELVRRAPDGRRRARPRGGARRQRGGRALRHRRGREGALPAARLAHRELRVPRTRPARTPRASTRRRARCCSRACASSTSWRGCARSCRRSTPRSLPGRAERRCRRSCSPLTQEVLLLLEIFPRVRRRRRSLARIPTTRCCARSRRWSSAGIVELRRSARRAGRRPPRRRCSRGAQLGRLREWVAAPPRRRRTAARRQAARGLARTRR